jgi:hypothetical protein
MSTLVAFFDMATQFRRAATLEIPEYTALLRRGNFTESVKVGGGVLPEDIGHFEPRFCHGVTSPATVGCDRSAAIGVATGAASAETFAVKWLRRSRGLLVPTTVFMDTNVYKAVVRRLRCPNSAWIVRISVPLSRR